MKNTNLDEVSGLHGNRPPLPHAVGEPGDVHHLHAVQIGRAAVLKPRPQRGGLAVLRHHVGDSVAAGTEGAGLELKGQSFSAVHFWPECENCVH